ncbi:MAG: DUF3526 domain-containing protein [Planctomycetota bacterium]
MKLLGHELCLLLRDRAAWVLIFLFAGALGYALWNGADLAQRQRETARTIGEGVTTFDKQVREALARQALDPRQLARQPLLAVLTPAPLPLLASGQADLAPSYEAISLFRLEQPSDARAEIENPSRLLAGRFDLAFVLVWLFPLFLLALAYDLIAGDRESGTLRMVLSRGIAPWKWLGVRALARGLPVISLALAATVLSGLTADAAVGARIAFACGVVLAYGCFWLAVAALVNGFAKSAASAASSAGAAWVSIVLVIPTLLNVVVESLHPMPSRAELVASAREASGDAERRGNEVLNSFYKDHPEWMPPGMQADFMQKLLAQQEEIGKAMDPVRERFAAELRAQQSLVETWRFVSPAIATHEALTDLAGTGYWRNEAYRTQVAAFKQTVEDFYAPRIHANRPITKDDLSAFPRFDFAEEPDSAWQSRVSTSIVGKLVLAFLLFVAAFQRLSARALSALTA